MQLVNQTSIVARCDAAPWPSSDDSEVRMGCLTAKATFRFADGACHLDDQAPLALFDADICTDLGFLPSDALPRNDATFEVILLGRAHALHECAVETMRVRLAVGEHARELVVTGDRVWNGHTPSQPIPFTSMPLTYAHAYGGTAEVEVDEYLTLPLCDPFNPLGKGFDLNPWLASLATQMEPPAGYPKTGYQQHLPNLEHPQGRVTTRSVAVWPACWATVVPPLGIAAFESLQGPESLGEPGSQEVPHAQGPIAPAALMRANPEWRLPAAPASRRIVMEGLHAAGNITFEIPPLSVVADFYVEGVSSRRALIPQILVLLPEEGIATLLYRSAFTFRWFPKDERCVRLRLASHDREGFC